MKKIIPLMILLIMLSSCNEVPAEIVEEILDTTPPVISIVGDEEVFIEVTNPIVKGEVVFTELYVDGAAVTDNIDENPTLITSGNFIDTSVTGTYIVYFNAFDSSGNIAEEVIRTVHVVNKEPGVITSFTYESYDFLGVSIQVFDFKDVLIELSANLYNDGVLIESIPITKDNQQIQFNNLENDIDYTLIVSGEYDLGCGSGTKLFIDSRISVGVYRTLGDDIKDLIADNDKYDALKQIIYLPYDNQNYISSERMILTLNNIDVEILEDLVRNGVKIVLVDENITDVYEYWDLKGEPIIGDPKGDTVDDRPGLCCDPIVAKIGYQGTSTSLILQLIGMYYAPLLEYAYDEFEIAFTEEAHTMFTHTNFTENLHAYFTECFAFYYHTESTNLKLQTDAPLTYQIIEDIIENFFHNQTQ